MTQHYSFAPDIRNKLKDSIKKDNFKNISYLLADYLLIITSIAACLCISFWFYPLALIFIGSRFRAFDNLLHEASHAKLFRNKFFNKWVTLIFCAFPVGNSLHAYRESHLTHHRTLGDPKNDPDYLRYIELGVDKFPLPKKDLVKHFLGVFCLLHLPTYLPGIFKTFGHTQGMPRDEVIAKIVFYSTGLFVIAYFNLWYEFLLFYIVPFFTTFQIIRYLAEIVEHAGLYGTSDKVMEISRNTFCGPLAEFILFPHADNYHLVHHLLPGVPHYAMKEVHEILLSDSNYEAAHHCHGYFWNRKPEYGSAMNEMIADNI